MNLMDPILIVTADPKSAQTIINMASRLGIRYKTINLIETAREWLSINNVSILFIDSRYGKSEPLALASFLWTRQPTATIGVFNMYDEVAQKWQLLLAGIQVLDKTAFPSDVENLLRVLPNSPEEKNNVSTKKIMLVEDLDSPRMIISSYIESFKLGTVTAVSSAKEALDILKNKPNAFFGIVTDINMPDMNGIEFTEVIRRHPALRHLPIIVCTAYSSTDNLVGALAAGITGFLIKPLKKELIKSELEKAWRIYINGTSPRLCEAKDAKLLGEALAGLSGNLG